MDAETLAVGAISTAIARCELLRPIITANDKTPFTDGDIHVYGGLPISNDTWEGRVPVQVKGRARKAKKRLAAFKVARTDLVAFQKDSGVLYFVVTIHPVTMQERAYYAILSPFKIKSLLDSAPKTATQISVPVKDLPRNERQIERVVQLALKTRDQGAAMGFSPILMERASSFELHLLEDFDAERPLVLNPVDTDFAVILNTSDGLSVPLNGGFKILPAEYVRTRRDIPISAGGVGFEHCTVRKLDAERVEAQLSEGLKLTFSKTGMNVTTNVSLTLEDVLDARLKSIEFYLALIDTRIVTIGSSSSPIEIGVDVDDSWLREHVQELRRLDELFTRMRVDTRLIDLAAIDPAKLSQLRVVHRALVDGEEVSLAGTKPTIGILPVGPWRILLIVSKGSDAKSWILTDPFDKETRGQFYSVVEESDGDRSAPVTAYELAARSGTSAILNLRLEEIVGSYDAIADFETTIGLANQQVLELLNAADSCEPRRSAFLNAARRLNEWLVAEEGIEPRNLINGWQIEFRCDGLASQQRDAVRELRRESRRGQVDRPLEVELACSLLLGDLEEADHLISRMPKSHADETKSWPIWRLRESWLRR